MKLIESYLENYVHSVDRAVAGYMTGKKNAELSFKDIHAATEKLEALPDAVYTKIMLELEDNVTTTLEKNFQGSFVTENDQQPKKPRKTWSGSVMKSATGPHEKDNKKRDVMKGKFRNEKHKQKVDEGVLGMTDIEGLNRLKSLAGMKQSNTDNITVQEASRRLRHLHELEMDPGYDDETFVDDEEMPMGTDVDGDMTDDFDGAGDNFEQDFDAEMDSEELIDEPVGGLEMSVDASTQIRTAIATIRTTYPNLKLSEVGAVKKELDSLVDEMRKEGLRYLEETKKYRLKK